ncbi:MAG: carbon monoxide dehydrogenase [Anaerolineaceae bacterium]|nr:carbon monoxide dehydrogenase [Anaerolineaceae bacterium]
MYPPKFDYYRAGSTAEAVSLAKEHNGKFLAGGHSLIPVMNLRLADPGALVDIGRLDMKGISSNGDTVTVGALTTHAMVAASGDVPAVLSEAAGMIGDPQVRNRGTVGGNIAHADPASDLPTVMLALKATIHTEGSSGSRSISADDFFVDLFATSLQEDEIITSVSVASEGKKTGSGYAKLFNPASRYAMVGAAAQVTVENGVCSSASVAVGGLTPKATRASSVEAALVGKKLDDDTLAAAAAAVANDLDDDVMGDMHASADYRRQMAPVFVRRALEKAAARAK